MSESWIYHKDFAAKIIDDAEMEACKAEGWVESPVELDKKDPDPYPPFEEPDKLPVMSKDKEPEKPVESGIAALKAEDVPGLKSLEKADLCQIAQERFKVELKARNTKEELLKELQSLFDAEEKQD